MDFRRCLVLFCGLFFMCGYVVQAADQNKVVEQLKSVVPNFHEAAEGVYRSGLLNAEAVPLLKDLGIKTIINFDDNRGRLRYEEEFLDASGIRRISIPWNGFDYPRDGDIKHFLELMREEELRPLLVHCKRGAERTGVAVASWRIREQGWTADRAYEEMKAHGFRAFWYGHLKDYVYQFARRYGSEKDSFENAFTRFKASLLHAVYQLRKLNPFAAAVEQ